MKKKLDMMKGERNIVKSAGSLKMSFKLNNHQLMCEYAGKEMMTNNVHEKKENF